MDFALFDTYLRRFMDAARDAALPIEDLAGDFLRCIIYLSIFWAAVQYLAGRAGDNAVSDFSRWLLRLWFICFIGANWLTIMTALMEGMLGIGAQVGGLAPEDMLTISKIMEVSQRIREPIWQHREALCVGIYSCVVNAQDILWYEVAYFTILGAHFIVAMQVAMAQMQFMYHSLAALLMLPTAPVSQLAFMSERGIGGVISNGLHLFVLSLIVGIGHVVFTVWEITPDVTVDHALMTALMSLMFLFFAWRARSISEGILNGGPNLSANMLGAAAVGAIMSATGLGRLAMSGAAATNKVALAGNRLLHGHASNPAQAAARAAGGVGANTGGRWNDPPTTKQQAAASRLGFSTAGMTRGEASVALQRAGHPDPSWYGQSGSGPSAGNAGGNTTAAASTPNTRMDRFRQSVGNVADAVHQHGIVGAPARAAWRRFNGPRP